MKLYHFTFWNRLRDIFIDGLLPNRMGIVYLTPNPQLIGFGKYEILLEVETDKNKLTAFDECREWEVLCWGRIAPENIKVIS